MRLFLVVALGGALGGVLRWTCGQLVADGGGFPVTTFAINVLGAFLLALLPAVPVVRRSRTVAVALGPGVLGGFTTLSAASEQTRALLDSGDVLTAGGYLVGTLVACLLAVTLSSELSTRAQQSDAAAEGADR